MGIFLWVICLFQLQVHLLNRILWDVTVISAVLSAALFIYQESMVVIVCLLSELFHVLQRSGHQKSCDNFYEDKQQTTKHHDNMKHGVLSLCSIRIFIPFCSFLCEITGLQAEVYLCTITSASSSSGASGKEKSNGEYWGWVNARCTGCHSVLGVTTLLLSPRPS